MVGTRTYHANALHAAGRREDAANAFADAERRQKDYPLLYSTSSRRYCDLLLARGDNAAARDRAAKTIVIARRNNWLLDIALDTLTLGCAHFGLALATIGAQQPAVAARNDARIALARLDEAIDALRASGQSDELPRGLLARAAFRRSVGDWDGVERDLDEVEEIAEPGPMKLHLCDMALERARECEAFAPLNGLIDYSPPKPERPGESERKVLHDEAAKQLAIAADYVEKCGYHRRDEELAELQAVLRGNRLFADLPPRV